MDSNDRSCEDDLGGNQEGEFQVCTPPCPAQISDLSLAKNLIPPGGYITVRGQGTYLSPVRGTRLYNTSERLTIPIVLSK